MCATTLRRGKKLLVRKRSCSSRDQSKNVCCKLKTSPRLNNEACSCGQDTFQCKDVESTHRTCEPKAVRQSNACLRCICDGKNVSTTNEQCICDGKNVSTMKEQCRARDEGLRASKATRKSEPEKSVGRPICNEGICGRSFEMHESNEHSQCPSEGNIDEQALVKTCNWTCSEIEPSSNQGVAVTRKSEQEGGVGRSTCNEGICGHKFITHASNEYSQRRCEGNVDERALVKTCNWTCNEIEPNANQGVAATRKSEQKENVGRSICNEGICGRKFITHASNERFQRQCEGNVDEQPLVKTCKYTCNEDDPKSNQGVAATRKSGQEESVGRSTCNEGVCAHKFITYENSERFQHQCEENIDERPLVKTCKYTCNEIDPKSNQEVAATRKSGQEASVGRSTCKEGVCGHKFIIYTSNESVQRRYDGNIDEQALVKTCNWTCNEPESNSHQQVAVGMWQHTKNRNERSQRPSEENVDEQALVKTCNWTCNEIEAVVSRESDHQAPGPSEDTKNKRQNDENNTKRKDSKECPCGVATSCSTNTPFRCQSKEGHAPETTQNQRICQRKSRENRAPLKTQNERCAGRTQTHVKLRKSTCSTCNEFTTKNRREDRVPLKTQNKSCASRSQSHVKHRSSTCSTCGEFTTENSSTGSSSTLSSKPIRIPLPKCICASMKPPRELRRDQDDVCGARPVEVSSEYSVRCKSRCTKDVSKPKIRVRRASAVAPCSCEDPGDSQEFHLSSSASSIEDTPGKVMRCRRKGEKLLRRDQNTSRCRQDRESYQKRAEGSKICTEFSSAGVQKNISHTSDLCKSKVSVCDRETCTYNVQPALVVTTPQCVCCPPKTTPCIIKFSKPTKTTHTVQTDDSAKVCVAKSQPCDLTICEKDKLCDAGTTNNGTGSSSTCYLIAYKKKKRNDFPTVQKRQDKACERVICSNMQQTSDVTTDVKTTSKSSFYSCASEVESKVQNVQPKESKKLRVIFKIDSPSHSDESIDLEMESWQQKGAQVKSPVAKGVSLEVCGTEPHEAPTSTMSLRVRQSHYTTCETQVESQASESASRDACKTTSVTDKHSCRKATTSTVSFQIEETYHTPGTLVEPPCLKDTGNDVCEECSGHQKATSTISVKIKKSCRTCGTLVELPCLKDASIDVCEECSGQQKTTSTVSFRIENSYHTTCSMPVESQHSEETSDEVCEECSKQQEATTTLVESQISKNIISEVCVCSESRKGISAISSQMEKSPATTHGASSISQIPESESSCECDESSEQQRSVEQQTSLIFPQKVASSPCYIYQYRVKDSKTYNVPPAVPSKELISTLSKSSEDSCGICSTPPQQEGSSAPSTSELSTTSLGGSCSCSISVEDEGTQTSLEIPCICLSSVEEESTATSLEMSCICSGDVKEESTGTSLEMSCICAGDVEEESTATSLEMSCICSRSIEEECAAATCAEVSPKELEVSITEATLVASGESCTCKAQQEEHASLTKPEQGDVETNECTCSEESSEVCWGSCETVRASSTEVEVLAKKPSSRMICECCLCNMKKGSRPTMKDQEVMVKIDSRDDVQVEERSDEDICGEECEFYKKERGKGDDGLIKLESFVEVTKDAEGTPSMQELVEEMLNGLPSLSKIPGHEVSMEIKKEGELSEVGSKAGENKEGELSEVGSKAGESIKTSDEFEQVAEERESTEGEAIAKEQVGEVTSKGDVVEGGEEKIERDLGETLKEETSDEDAAQKLGEESHEEVAIQEQLNICKNCLSVCPGIPKELLELYQFIKEGNKIEFEGGKLKITTLEEQELRIISSQVSAPPRDEELKTVPSEVAVGEDQEPRITVSETPEQKLKATLSEASAIQVEVSPQRTISDQVPERPEVGKEVLKPDTEAIIASEEYIAKIKGEELAEIKRASDRVLEPISKPGEQVESITAPHERAPGVSEALLRPGEQVETIPRPGQPVESITAPHERAPGVSEALLRPGEQVETITKPGQPVESITAPHKRAPEVSEALLRPGEQVETIPRPGQPVEFVPTSIERVIEQQAVTYVRGEPVESVLEPVTQVTAEPRLGDQKIREHHPSLEGRFTTSTPPFETSTPAESKLTPDAAPPKEEARGDQKFERSEPPVQVLVQPRAGVSSSSKASSEDDVALGDHLPVPAPLTLDELERRLETSSTEDTFQSTVDVQASKEQPKVLETTMGDQLESAYLNFQVRSSRESITSSEMLATARSSSATLLDAVEIVTEAELPEEQLVELPEDRVSDLDQWSLGLPEGKHAQCDCIDCIFLTEVEQVARKKSLEVHPSDCTCVECITDPTGFTCGDVPIPVVTDDHGMACDCLDCLFKPSSVEKVPGLHAPDCDCLDCLCDPCLEEPQVQKCPECDCENCICEPCEFAEEHSEEDCTCEPCLKEASRKRGKDKGDRLDSLAKKATERSGKDGEGRRAGFKCPVCVCDFCEKLGKKGIGGGLRSSSEPCDFSCAKGDVRQETVSGCKCDKDLDNITSSITSKPRASISERVSERQPTSFDSKQSPSCPCKVCPNKFQEELGQLPKSKNQTASCKCPVCICGFCSKCNRFNCTCLGSKSSFECKRARGEEDDQAYITTSSEKCICTPSSNLHTDSAERPAEEAKFDVESSADAVRECPREICGCFPCEGHPKATGVSEDADSVRECPRETCVCYPCEDPVKDKGVSGDVEHEKVSCNCLICKCDSCEGLVKTKEVPSPGLDTRTSAGKLRCPCQVCECDPCGDPLRLIEVSKNLSKLKARSRPPSTGIIDEAKMRDIELSCQICQCDSCSNPMKSKLISKEVKDIFKADQLKYNLASRKSEEVAREDTVGRSGDGTDTFQICDCNPNYCRESYNDLKEPAEFNETCHTCMILKGRASKCGCHECVFKREQGKSRNGSSQKLPKPNIPRTSLSETKRTQRVCVSSSEIKKEQRVCTPCSSKPFETARDSERVQRCTQLKQNVSAFVQCVLSKIKGGKSKEKVQSKRDLSKSSHECVECKERRKTEDFEIAGRKKTVDLKCLCEQLTGTPRRREQAKDIALPKPDKTLSQMKLLLMMLKNKCRSDDEKIGKMFLELKAKTNCKNYGDVLKKIATQVPTKIFQSALKLCVKVSRPLELKSSAEGKCTCDGTSVEIVKILKIGPDAFLAKWIAPKDKPVLGYEIYVDNVLKSCVYNGKRTSTVIFGVKLLCETHVTVLALTANTKC